MKKKSRFPGSFRISCQGFTLLELCVTMAIAFLFLAIAMPSMESAFTERSLRGDSNQFALLVRKGMIGAQDENLPYQLTFSEHQMSLEKILPKTSDDKTDQEEKNDSVETQKSSAVILVPNPEKPKEWIPAKSEIWTFEPGELCPQNQVRIQSGESWIELSFNLLTGEVENEKSYLP